MAKTYRYRGRRADGQQTSGLLAAADANAAYRQLMEQGIAVAALAEEGRPKGKKRLTDKQVAAFAREMSFILQSGIPMRNGLALIEAEAKSLDIRQWIGEIRGALQTGASLLQAIEGSSYQVPSLFLAFVRLGEARGQLASGMHDAAENLEANARLKNDIQGALLYPALVFGLINGVILFLLLFILPVLAESYQNMGVPISIWLKALLLFGHFLRSYGMPLIGLAILAGAASFVARQGTNRRDGLVLQIKRLILPIPLAGRLLKHAYFIAFSRSLSQLLQSGISLVPGIALLAEQEEDQLFADDLAQIRRTLAQGGSFVGALGRCTFVPEVATQLIGIGEQSGHLAEALGKNAAFYELKFRQDLAQMTKIIEPVLIVFLGLAILFIAVSLFVPMLTSYGHMLN